MTILPAAESTPAVVPPPGRNLSSAAMPALLFILAFALRAGYILQIRGNPFFYNLALGTDQEVFDRVALRILGGEWLAGSAGDSPLYPCVLLPILYALTGANLLYARLIQALLGSLTAVFLCLLGRRVGNPAVGILSGLIAAIYAPFIVYDAAILGESSLILLTVITLVCLCRAAEHPTVPNFALAGLALGLTLNAKPTALLFIPFALLWLVFARPLRLSFILTRAAILVLAALLIVAPFIYRAYRISGKLFPVRGNSGIIFLMGNNPTANGAFKYPSGEFGERFARATDGKPLAERDRIAYRMAWDFIRENPGQFLKLTARKLWLFCSPTEVGNNLSITYYRQISMLRYPPFLTLGLVLPLAIVGLAVSLEQWRRCMLLYLFILTSTAATVPFIVVDRYRLPTVAALIPLAATGALYVIEPARSRSWRACASRLAVAAVLTCGINASPLYRALYPLFHPHGMRAGVDGMLVVRDDADRPTPYAATLDGPGHQVRKKLLLGPHELAAAKQAFLAINCAAAPSTRWHIRVNDIEAPGPTLPDSNFGWLRLQLKPNVLRPGPNDILVRLESGVLKVVVDETFTFKRSFVLDKGGTWRFDRLDTHTFQRFRSLHMPTGEFRIRIHLAREAR